MKLICAGLPKTGTTSIACALRILGYKVYDYDQQILSYGEQWLELFNHGKVPDFYTMFKDVDAVIDYPGNIFFEELMEAFPDAKVILSVRRDEEEWVKSARNYANIWETSYLVKIRYLLPTFNKFMGIVRYCRMAATGIMVPNSTYVCRKRYRWHNDRVKSVVPAEKLLVYSVDEGWKPLCELTGKKMIPDQPFPHLNIKGSNLYTFQRETEFGRQVRSEVNVVKVCCVVIVALIGVLFMYFA